MPCDGSFLTSSKFSTSSSRDELAAGSPVFVVRIGPWLCLSKAQQPAIQQSVPAISIDRFRTTEHQRYRLSGVAQQNICKTPVSDYSEIWTNTTNTPKDRAGICADSGLFLRFRNT